MEDYLSTEDELDDDLVVKTKWQTTALLFLFTSDKLNGSYITLDHVMTYKMTLIVEAHIS